MPTLLETGYQLRDRLRGQEETNLSSESLVFGKFVGRLSSISNLAFIMENIDFFYLSQNEIDELECCNKYNQSNSLYNDVRKRMPWYRSYGYRRSIKEYLTAIMLSLDSRLMSLLLRLK